jgi:hypothetical protein
MKKSLLVNYGLLLLLTFSTILTHQLFVNQIFISVFILLLFAIKFLLVAFKFMELKKAHQFWKISVLITLGLLMVVIVGLR